VSDFIFFDDFALRLTMRPEKRRQSWPLQQGSVGVMIGTVTLSQIVHLTLRGMLDPDANFEK
jgi:hypothetical protein